MYRLGKRRECDCMEKLKVTQCQGEGAGSCRRCIEKGRWSNEWMFRLYKIEGFEGCYCFDCVKEIEAERGNVNV